jgi:hypothetical protein
MWLFRVALHESEWKLGKLGQVLELAQDEEPAREQELALGQELGPGVELELGRELEQDAAQELELELHTYWSHSSTGNQRL